MAMEKILHSVPIIHSKPIVHSKPIENREEFIEDYKFTKYLQDKFDNQKSKGEYK